MMTDLRAALAKESETINVERDPEDGSWAVSLPDLPGHVGAGETLEEAVAMALDAASAWAAIPGEAEGLRARTVDAPRLREEFVRALTVDSETKDRRRGGFNQAIFDAKGGWQVFNGTDLGMVMEKFDQAVRAALAASQDGGKP